MDSFKQKVFSAKRLWHLHCHCIVVSMDGLATISSAHLCIRDLLWIAYMHSCRSFTDLLTCRLFHMAMLNFLSIFKFLPCQVAVLHATMSTLRTCKLGHSQTHNEAELAQSRSTSQQQFQLDQFQSGSATAWELKSLYTSRLSPNPLQCEHALLVLLLYVFWALVP